MTTRVREIGTIVNVKEELQGGTIAAAASMGATTIYVDDTADFDEEGGQLTLGGTVYSYTTVDDDTGAIALTAGLAAAADDNDRATLYPEAVDRWALVRIDDARDIGDAVWMRVKHALFDKVLLGTRDERQWCEATFDGEVWEVTDLLGKTPDYDTGVLPDTGHNHDGYGENAVVTSGDTQNAPAQALGANSVASGEGAVASGDGSVAQGFEVVARGPLDVVIGATSETTDTPDKDNRVSIGGTNHVGGDNAVALGQGIWIDDDHDNSVGLGSNSDTTDANQIQILDRHIEIVAMPEPDPGPTGGTGSVRLYCVDVSGEPEFYAVFPDGNRTRIAPGQNASVGIAIGDPDYTVARTVGHVRVTTGSSDKTCYLPAATGSGRRISFKKLDTAAGMVLITADGSDLIDGAASFSLTLRYDSVTIIDAAAGVWDIV